MNTNTNQMDDISPGIIIAIGFACIFVLTTIIFYLCITKSIENEEYEEKDITDISDTYTTTLDNDNNSIEAGVMSSIGSVSSSISTLPYRSSSNMTLISFSGEIGRKKTELVSELRLNTIKWVAICRVGAGGFSEVFHVIDKISKKSLAMKWIRIERSVSKRKSSQKLFKTFR
eukprot:273520_1